MNLSKTTYIESGTRPKLSDELVPLMNKNIKCSIRLNTSKDAVAPNSDIYLLIKCRLENSLDYLTNKKVKERILKKAEKKKKKMVKFLQ